MLGDMVDGRPPCGHCPLLPQAMRIKNKGVLRVGVPSMQDLQQWAEQSQSCKDYKQSSLKMFEVATQWLAERRVNVILKLLSASGDMERKSTIGLRVRQISASPVLILGPEGLSSGDTSTRNEAMQIIGRNSWGVPVNRIRIIGARFLVSSEIRQHPKICDNCLP